MKKISWLLGLVLLVVFSCDETSITDSDFIAGDSFTESNIRVLLLDTLTVEASTMKYDSIITSKASRILVGKYIDTVFGTVKSASYMRVLPSSYTIDSDAVYDSIVLYLHLDTYYYNDTLQTSTIHIKQLSETLKPSDNSDFYNTSKIGFLENDIGILKFTPRPLSVDSLEIKLSDTLGVGFFEKLQQKEITNSDEFKTYFKGFTIQPGVADNGAVLGFSKAESFVRLYYSIAEEEEQVQEFTDFYIDTGSSPTPFFNQITSESTNEYLESLTDVEINLNSVDADHKTYIQSGIGIATRIELPYLKSIFNIPGNGTLLNAILKIKPTANWYSDDLSLRETLSVYVVDKNNVLVDVVSQADGEAVLATLNTDNKEFNDIYYEIPLSSYVEDLLLAERDTGEALILLPEDYAESIDRMVLNGNESLVDKTILELTYAIYDED